MMLAGQGGAGEALGFLLLSRFLLIEVFDSGFEQQLKAKASNILNIGLPASFAAS
jgi:hypothetical protein